MNQGTNDSCLDETDNRGDKKWLNNSCILKLGPAGCSDQLIVGHAKQTGNKTTPRFSF